MILFLAAIAFLVSFTLLGYLWSTIERAIERNERAETAAQCRINAARMGERHYVRGFR